MISKVIRIDGPIGQGDGEVSAQMVRSQLPPNGTDPIVVKIHSEGGVVFEGFAIHDMLDSYQGPKSCVIESAAFSIASFIAMAFDDVQITPNGYMMLHNPSIDVGGDDEFLAKTAGELAQLKENMVAAYARKSGKPVDEVLAILKAETRYNAQQSVANGFADRITEKPVTGRAFARLDSLPHGVVTALFGEGSGGEHRETTQENLMSTSQPVAATVKEIKAAYPRAKSDFIVRCLERQLPMASVANEIVEEVTTENETLASKVAAMEEELAKARAQLDELSARARAMNGDDEEAARAQEEEEQARAEEEEQAKAKARRTGAAAVARRPGSGGCPTARERWRSAIDAKVATGVPKAKAVSLVNRENPGLRERMLKEVNAR